MLWREDDVTIYSVPQRTPSLAHVVPWESLTRGPDVAELRKFVDALDDPSLPAAQMDWRSFRGARIRAVVRPGQVISVQTGYHPGWHAAANGRSAPVVRDGLGLVAIRPECDGPCDVALDYDGGWEYQLCRAISGLTILAAAGLAALQLFRRRSDFFSWPRSRPSVRCPAVAARTDAWPCRHA